jgi:hypothetical protein
VLCTPTNVGHTRKTVEHKWAAPNIFSSSPGPELGRASPMEGFFSRLKAAQCFFLGVLGGSSFKAFFLLVIVSIR